MFALVKTYVVAFECGHSTTYNTHPHFAPQVGDVSRCSTCRCQRHITTVISTEREKKVRVA